MKTNARPGEIAIKQWVMEEATRTGLRVGSIYSRVYRGRYPALRRRWVNARVVFVLPASPPATP